MNNELNVDSLTGLTGALAYAMGIEPPAEAEAPNAALCKFVDEAFEGRKVDRIFMYNPDAVAEWVYRKYPQLMKEAVDVTQLELPMQTVMPSVTPVCFGTMYTGAQPAVHGIRKYEKPVIAIDTLFDALIRAGKKPCIISQTPKCSMSNIFNGREMMYFVGGTIESATAKAMEVIIRDEYDFVVVYHGNYDALMHKFGPESIEALSELRCNVRTFGAFVSQIKEHWQGHDVLYGFAMDHGCHLIDGDCGSHGLDMPEDLNICHLYGAQKKQ
jgi:predicted AlkP superfamily pyrophosphatase or phosphodiesterase